MRQGHKLRGGSSIYAQSTAAKLLLPEFSTASATESETEQHVDKRTLALSMLQLLTDRLFFDKKGYVAAKAAWSTQFS